MGLLIVDDEEGVRRSLRKALEHDGYAVHTARNGRDAIELVKRCMEGIETVICDFKMPGIDGLETLVEIGRLNPEITRIMLTGYATMESAIESVNAGIDGFITKPFLNAELRVKVRECTLKRRLKQFVSEEVFREMQKEGMRILPRLRKATILFCDIRGFTELSERLTGDELSELVNVKYFSPMDRIICEHDGTLDKHIGDGIMGVFGVPVAQDDAALRAVRCAGAMMREIAGRNSAGLSIGIGISTGEVLAGIFGSPRKKEYTVFGPPVNVAARLESRAGKDQILICEETMRETQGIAPVHRVDPLVMKGTLRKVGVYALLNSLP